jgi:hypothetical protein
MTDIIEQTGQDAEQIIGDIVAVLRILDRDVLALIKAIVAGVRMGGDIAAALVPAAQLLRDAETGAQQLAQDVSADVPPPVKAFVEGAGVLQATIALPVLGALTGVLYRGTHDELVAKVAGGMPI